MDTVSTGQIHPTQGIGGGVALRDPDGKLVIPDEEQVRELASGTLYIVSYGRVEYSDIFGVRHWVTFCSYTDKLIRDPNSHAISHVKCAAYNNGDTNQFMTLPPEAAQPAEQPLEEIVCKVPKH